MRCMENSGVLWRWVDRLGRCWDAQESVADDDNRSCIVEFPINRRSKVFLGWAKTERRRGVEEREGEERREPTRVGECGSECQREGDRFRKYRLNPKEDYIRKRE